jgi:glucokinase
LYGRPPATTGAAAAAAAAIGAAAGVGCAVAVSLVQDGKSLPGGASHMSVSEGAPAAVTVTGEVCNTTEQCTTTEREKSDSRFESCSVC